MSEESGTWASLFRDGYQRVFIKEWSSLTGGVLVGIMSVFSFTWARPWGVVGGLRVWADWFFYAVGLYDVRPPSPWTDTNSLITLGLIWGALAASLVDRQFALRMPPRLEFFKALAGGTLLGIGSALAGGCNVGGFYSSISALSLSGVAMMAGLLAGAWVGLKYLYWEMEHLSPGRVLSLPVLWDWTPVKPWLGWALLVSGLLLYWLYNAAGYTIEGGVVLCGIGFGVILVRSRFCFARAFREPFMTGEATVTHAVIMSLVISIIGFTILKWNGLRGELVYVTPTFGLGALVGGFIFGIGMLVTGGCGSGTAWRAAEGQIKLILALVVFALTNSLTKAFMNAWEPLRSFIGVRVFLPDVLGYGWALLGILVLLGAWYLVVSWNERTDRFVVEM